jgi:hypothetical protein
MAGHLDIFAAPMGDNRSPVERTWERRIDRPHGVTIQASAAQSWGVTGEEAHG